MSIRFSRRAAIALMLGLAGWLLNDLPIPLGWGLHMVLGNVVVWAGMRVVGPGLTVAALSAISAQTILLWHHPWAWLVWTLEAAAVAFLHRRDTPVTVDMVFWAVLGAPLLAVTYGLVMGMDWTSVGLVVVKQAFNGVLCVTLGEVLYLSVTEAGRRLKRLDIPRMRFRSMMMALLMSFVLIPGGVYTYLNSVAGLSTLTQSFDVRLQQTIDENLTGFQDWLRERRDGLRALAEQSAGIEPSCERIPAGSIADDRFWIMPIGGCKAMNDEHSLALSDLLSDGLLSDLHDGSLERVPHIEFLVATSSPPRLVYNSVFVGGLWARFAAAKDRKDVGLILLDRIGRPTLQFWPRNTDPKTADQAMATIAARDLKDTAVITTSGFGQSVMTDFNKSLLVRSTSIEAPAAGWRMAAMLSPRDGILAGRQAQFVALTVMLSLAAFAALAAALVTRYGEVMVADLYGALSRIDDPLAGSRIHRLLAVEEIDAIQSELDRTGEIFREDRSLMGLYERRMRQVEAHAPVIVYSLAVSNGEKGPLNYVSASAERILGFELAEIAEPGWWSHNIHPDDYAGVRRAFSGLQPDSVATAEYRLQRKDGTYSWVYDTLSTSDDGQGVGVLFDVSRRKAAELQLIQTAKLASLGEMATGMAHELNQPLNIIKMAASNLLRRARSNSAKAADLTERLQRIIEQTDRASSLIGHMRVFGRKPEEAPSIFLARDAIDGALALIGRQMSLGRIELIVEERIENLEVEGYLTLLEQVILNLILNARDAIVSTAETDEARERWIRLVLDRSGDQIVLQVEDSGGGIPEATLERVFEPFFTTKPIQSGTGLGLSVSYGIVRDMHGTIEVTNAELGARFTIRLPAASA